MGQYYTIINLTKKEYISPHALNDGAKLLELNNTLTGLAVLLANSNGRGGGDLNVHGDYNTKTRKWSYTEEQKEKLAKVQAVAGRWAGDKIVIQGDYAEKDDPAFVSEKRFKDFACINDLVRDALSTDSYLAQNLEDKF